MLKLTKQKHPELLKKQIETAQKFINDEET